MTSKYSKENVSLSDDLLVLDYHEHDLRISTLLLRVFEQSFVLIHFTSPCKPQIHDHTRDKNIFLSRTCSDTNSILAYSRETSVFYIYYVLKTFTSIFCEGSVFCLALAYVVATTVAIFSTVYMRIFLPDSIRDNSLVTSIVSTEKLSYVLLEDYPGHRNQISRTVRSVREMASLMRSSVPLFQVAMVSFFSSLSEAGLHASSMLQIRVFEFVNCFTQYYLKAKFQFNKDQFADLMIIFGIAGSVSQVEEN
ncbi:hypothetical protein F2Q69_00022670 [Brassica cretica]|uniref:Uncharacterized protein n=1 Tax=Brassica cretica TaxID=69181 RepID=A0A8S9QA93_BRACR|nr:hypothetical protein F2Q69_00022670 [Brassica cretica]